MSVPIHRRRCIRVASRFPWAAALAVWCALLVVAEARAQEPADVPSDPSERIDIEPTAHDAEIRERLEGVLEATGWFREPRVRVENGVVFLGGGAESQELKDWASDLARNTEGAVAVANRMQIHEPSAWDFDPAWSELRVLWRDVVRSLPILLFALLVLVLFALGGSLASRGARRLLQSRVRARLLREVLARGAGGVVFLLGVYVTLRVAGLTQLALTLVGGTGLIGLVVGIAFRDITENFLASILLSMQRPFETGDLIEVAGETGYVQQMNVRTTVLMTFEGNLLQIPNSSVYKSNLRNFTTNASRRENFVVGIGYDAPIDAAQEVARKVLVEHPAVLDDPEPAVLVDGLGRATVDLRVYFWLDGRAHSWLKVRSSVIRLVKLAFQKHGISMPDEAREVIFPRGVPVSLNESLPEEKERERAPHEEREVATSKAEGGLESEAETLAQQARNGRQSEGENLLSGSASSSDTDRG